MSTEGTSSKTTASDGPSSSAALEFDNYTQIDEPSPLDRILADGRNYNGGNWTSDELKKLSDAVYKYGTNEGSIRCAASKIKTRSLIEIKAKVDEVREIIKESKEMILPDFYRKTWTEMGHRNIAPPLDSDVDLDETWTSVISKVNSHHHPNMNKQVNPVREGLENTFKTFASNSKVQEDALVTSINTANAAIEDRQSVRWPLIYEFMRACTALEDQMPALNELEAAIVVNVLDTIEDEASAISDNEKAFMAGIFNECQLGDFRLCEQDHPPNVLSGMQLFLDPLRTRAHGIPVVAAEIEIPSDDKPSTSST